MIYMALSIELTKQMNYLKNQVLEAYPHNNAIIEEVFKSIIITLTKRFLTNKLQTNTDITSHFNLIQQYIQSLSFLTCNELNEMEEIIYAIFIRLLALAEFIEGYNSANNLIRLITHRLDIIYVIKNKNLILKTFQR